jgi:hypothetical protein
MLRNRLFRSVAGRLANATRSRSARLSVEALDDRVLPSTFTVGNLSDSGPGSLRQAVLDANANSGADLIRFAPAARDGTITLTSGQLSITDDLTIDGPGVHRLTISGNDASRVFSVSGGETDVEIRDLTITNGRATGTTVVGPVGPVTVGGGVLNTGARVTLSHVTMDNNQAVGPSAQGGAIASFSGATLVVTDSTFTENRATGTLFGSAGAIVSDGGSVMVLDHCTFTGNQATASLGAGLLFFQGNAVGGAVKSAGGSQATVLHTTFEGNLARGGNGSDGGPGQKGGDGGFGVGGALENAFFSFVGPPASSTMTAEYCTFLANTALGGSGGTGGTGAAGGNGRGGPGGAISNVGTLTISHSTFVGNQGRGGNGGNGGVGGNGGAGAGDTSGAINNSNPVGGVPVFANLHISESLFLDNEGIGGAGGNGGSGGNGGAGGEGRGAIGNFSSSLTVSDSTFLGNQALGGNGGHGGNGGSGGNGSGGAIANSAGSAGITFHATLHVSESLFLDNEAIGGSGGDGGSSGNGGAGGVGQGGGLSNQFTDWDIRGSLFDLNQATGGAGGDKGIGGLLGGAGGAGQGGGLSNLIGSIGALSDSIVILNTATGGAGGVGGNGGNGQGGGVFNGGPSPQGTPSLTLLRSIVALNRADGGTAGDGGSAGLGQGGGLYLSLGGVASADLWTFIFANDASTSDDDLFGIFG